MKYLSKDEHDYITITCIKCGSPHRSRKSCGFRFCPFCSRKRQLRVRDHLSQLFSAYRSIPGYRLRMITLSTKNCQDLSKGVTHLLKSFRKLRNSQKWLRYVSGGVCLVEIKGRPNDWHPHLHIIAYSKFLPWQWLQKQWHKCSGGSAVWINEVTKDRAKFYVTKYVTKIDMPAEAQDEPNSVMKGRRLFMKFGEFAQYEIQPRKWLWLCPVCGCEDFLTEFEIRRCQRKLP